MAKIIALDYGAKRTGIAVTDDLQIIASGLTTVESPLLLKFLEDYLLKNKVEAIVLGYPTRLDGSDTHNTKPVEELALKLKNKFPVLSIHLEDERFTSKMARVSMLQMGMKKKNREKKELLDEISAVLILQAFLEQNG
jgi:putative Holliday junction resolvase